MPALWFCLLALLAAPAVAELQTDLERRDYRVSLRQGESLAAALDRASPVRRRGLVYHGSTQWQVQWRFWWRQDASGCAIERVRTEVSVHMRLPRLSGANDQQRQRFELYLTALEAHEMGHYNLAVLAGKAVEQRLQALPAAADCAALETRANEAGHRLLEDFRAREADYDRRTNHGQSQGAWLD